LDKASICPYFTYDAIVVGWRYPIDKNGISAVRLHMNGMNCDGGHVSRSMWLPPRIYEAISKFDIGVKGQ